MKINWEEIKGIQQGKVLNKQGNNITEEYENVARIGGDLYIKLSDLPFGISDQLEETEDYAGEAYAKLSAALELDGKGESDEDFLYQHKELGDVALEQTRLIPAKVNDKIYVGLELTLNELEKRYFENEPESFIAGKIRLQNSLDEKFDQYILMRKQEQLNAYKQRLEVEGVERREKIEEYLKTKLFDVNRLSIPELKNIESFSFTNLPQEQKKEFLQKIKSNYNRLQQYTDEFLDLINVKVLGESANELREKTLKYIKLMQLVNLRILSENRDGYYELCQAESDLMEQGLLARLFEKPLSEEEFENKYGKTVEEAKTDINKRKTLFQRHLGREVLDKFAPVDLGTNEESILVNAGNTNKSIRKAYHFGEDRDELGVIRHKLDAKDLVNIGEIFNYSRDWLLARIQKVRSEVLFENAHLNSWKAAWLYTNAAIIEWYDKVQEAKTKANTEKTNNLAANLQKLAKKFQAGTVEESDQKRLSRITKQLNDTAGREKMLEEKIVGIFDKRKRNELMEEKSSTLDRLQKQISEELE